jgi:hypothetical protein
VTATTATEPFHVSTALATIDVVGRGRAGWVLTVEDPDAVRGTVTWEVPDDAAGDAAEHLAVRGPSITPRPPQGHPPVLVRAHDDATLALALRHADALLTRDPALARGAAGTGASDAGTSAAPLRLLELDAAPGDAAALAARIAEEHAAGVDGVVLHARELEGVLETLLPALADAGVRPAADGPGPEPDATGEHPATDAPRTLRSTLGLPPAPNRFEVPA